MDRYSSGYTMVESFYAASRFLYWEDVIGGDPMCCPCYKKSVSRTRVGTNQSGTNPAGVEP
jgi:hypothetical protein